MHVYEVEVQVGGSSHSVYVELPATDAWDQAFAVVRAGLSRQAQRWARLVAV